MHKNTHRLCERCWEKREPDRVPVRVKNDEEGPCCLCGEPTSSGIYVLERQTFEFCAGNHSEEPSSGAPFIGFSGDTLEKLPPAKEGDTVKCKHCGESHELKVVDPAAKDVLFFTCGGDSYLGAVGGRLVAFQEPDVSGGSKED